MIGGATGHDDHAVDGLQGLRTQTQAVQEHLTLGTDALRKSVGQRCGLLVDLLQHESLVAGLLGRIIVPVDLQRLPVDEGALQVGEFDALGPDHDHLAVIREHNPAGFGHEGGDGGSQVVLTLTEADDERGLLPYGHDGLRLVHGDRAEGEVPIHGPVCVGHCLPETAPVGPLDEVGDHLGIGLGRERVSIGLQFCPQGHVVLHDAVENDGEAAAAVGVRMRILVGGTAVCRPARVRYPYRGRVAEFVQAHFKVVEVPHRVDQPQTAVFSAGDPGRVIPPVFKLAKAPKEDVPAGAFPHIPDDTAHQPQTSVVRSLLLAEAEFHIG